MRDGHVAINMSAAPILNMQTDVSTLMLLPPSPRPSIRPGRSTWLRTSG